MDTSRDKAERIAAAAEYAVAILANLTTDDVQFVELADLPADTARAFTARGLVFCGVIGLIDGAPRTALDVELSEEDSARMKQAFLAHVRKHARWVMSPDMHAN